MENRYVMKIYPQGNARQVYRVIELSGRETLDKLCQVILSAFEFYDEHLYEFCMDCKMYSHDSYQSDPEVDERSTRTKVGKLGLGEKQKFALHYDFGDDWMFIINVQKIIPEMEYEEPRIIKSKGKLEQYPTWDEDEWDGY